MSPYRAHRITRAGLALLPAVLRWLVLGCALGATLLAAAQRPAYFEHAGAELVRARELFDMAQYGAARSICDQFAARIRDPHDAARIEAEYYAAICAVRLGNDDAANLLRAFLHAHPENFRVAAINLELFRHHFNQKHWDDALACAKDVDPNGLGAADRDEFMFKKGYALFQLERPDESLPEFARVKDGTSAYAPSATYYTAHIHYTRRNYEAALQGFEKLKADEAFGRVVPYYIAQIKFLKGDYNALLEYTRPLLADPEGAKNTGDINRLAGEAYYRTGQYKEAQPYLEKSLQRPGVERGDRYVAGYVFYRNGEYKRALDQLNQVAAPAGRPAEDSLAQMAAYHMADCYLQLNEKNYARNAFKRAHELGMDPRITEDALFNYAKLAYELSFDPYNEAVIALRDYLKAFPGSPRNDEAQRFLMNVYLRTRNHEAALEALDAIREKDMKLQEVYQQLAYNRGVELFEARKYPEADRAFERSLKYPVDRALIARTHYWRGEAAYAREDHTGALKQYDLLRNTTGAYATDLYEQASYSMGYAYFKRREFDEAATALRRFAGAAGVPGDQKADAMLRIGDCYYVMKDEATAIKWYDDAIAAGAGARDYALFQKGMCQGLDQQYDRKIATLRKLLDEKPNSAFAADARFELGETYINLEKDADALRYYQQVINEHPNSPNVRQSMLQSALIHRRRGDMEKAIAAFKGVVEKYPTVEGSREALAGLESIHVEQGRVADYEAYVRSLNFVDPGSLKLDETYFLSAEQLYQAGNCDAAVGALADYLNKYPGGAYVLKATFYSADCLYRAKKDAEALPKFEEVVRRGAAEFMEPSLVAASDILFRQARWEAALPYFEQLEARAADTRNVLAGQVGRMRCLRSMDRLDDAAAAAEKVTKNADANADLRSEAALVAAMGLLARNELDAAHTKFKAVARDARAVLAAEARYHMAYVRYLQKKYAEAETEVFELAKKFPAQEKWKGKAFILLADTYVQMDDRFQAKATLQSVIDHSEIPDIVEEARARLATIEAGELAPQAPAGEGNNEGEKP